jgi:hypothetical protein
MGLLPTQASSFKNLSKKLKAAWLANSDISYQNVFKLKREIYQKFLETG